MEVLIIIYKIGFALFSKIKYKYFVLSTSSNIKS